MRSWKDGKRYRDIEKEKRDIYRNTGRSSSHEMNEEREKMQNK